MAQDITVGQEPAGHQRMIGTAKARIGHLDQHLIGCHLIIGNLLVDKPLVFDEIQQLS